MVIVRISFDKNRVVEIYGGASEINLLNVKGLKRSVPFFVLRGGWRWLKRRQKK